MKPSIVKAEAESEILDDHEHRVLREIVRAVRSVAFGSVEIVIHNSRIIQIERKEKLRFDRG
jgi:hypothetical protein